MGVALLGKDYLLLNLRLFSDYAHGDVVAVDVPNNLVEMKKGKNGNAVIAFNSTGEQGDLKVRLLLGSGDDKHLASEQASYLNDPVSYVVLSGEYVKRVGDGSGNVTVVIYQLSGGAIKKFPVIKENTEGDTEQGVVEYTISFAKIKPIRG